MALELFSLIDVGAMYAGFLAFLPRFMAGVLVFAALYVLYLVTVLIIRVALERRRVHSSLIAITVKTYKYVMIVVGLVLAISQMGVDLLAALAGLGIIGVALGFGAKDALSNYIAGVTIFWDKPFFVGDYIEVNGLYGRVTEITMRSTRIRTLGNSYLVVPNQVMVDSLVVNHSKNGEVRIDVPVSISYTDSIALAREALLGIVDSERDTRLSPYLRPSVVVKELGDNGVLLSLRLWLNKAEDERAVLFEYLERAKFAIEDHGMTIPFPQRVLHHEDIWHEKRKTRPLEKSH